MRGRVKGTPGSLNEFIQCTIISLAAVQESVIYRPFSAPCGVSPSLCLSSFQSHLCHGSVHKELWFSAGPLSKPNFSQDCGLLDGRG